MILIAFRYFCCYICYIFCHDFDWHKNCTQNELTTTQWKLFFDQRHIDQFLQLFLQYRFVRQLQFIFCYHHRRQRSAHRIFYYLIILRSTKNHSHAWILILFLLLAIQRLQVEIHFWNIFRFEFTDFQFKGNQTLQTSMKE